MFPDTEAGNELCIDMKSKDKDGNLTEHIRIHQDGREEIIFKAGEKQV
jgi:hypothetical protein